MKPEQRESWFNLCVYDVFVNVFNIDPSTPIVFFKLINTHRIFQKSERIRDEFKLLTSLWASPKKKNHNK